MEQLTIDQIENALTHDLDNYVAISTKSDKQFWIDLNREIIFVVYIDPVEEIVECTCAYWACQKDIKDIIFTHVILGNSIQYDPRVVLTGKWVVTKKTSWILYLKYVKGE